MLRIIFGESSAATIIGSLLMLFAGIALVWLGITSLEPLPADHQGPRDFPFRAVGAVVLGVGLMAWGFLPYARRLKAYFHD